MMRAQHKMPTLVLNTKCVVDYDELMTLQNHAAA